VLGAEAAAGGINPGVQIRRVDVVPKFVRRQPELRFKAEVSGGGFRILRFFKTCHRASYNFSVRGRTSTGLPLLFSQSLGLSKKFGSRNACIESGKFESVPLGEQEEMGAVQHSGYFTEK